MSSELLWNSLSFKAFRRLFYLVTPSEMSHKSYNEVPNYLDESILWFVIFMLLENLVHFYKQRQLACRLNDAVTSVGAGLLQTLINKVVLRSFEAAAYLWIYKHCQLVDLPWNSPLTWWIGFLGVDCAYYWFHRMGHEMALFWSFHQMHHSSEDYNLSTALRQSVLQTYSSFLFYLPLALAVPPPIFLAHSYLNLLYQFWIHTEMITTLGPLEFVLNTPSHHRVHHGRNPYCIDKNYGGTLIIWDRIFGTFCAEKKEEKVVYGLIHNVHSFDAFYTQFFVLKWVLWDKLRTFDSWLDRLRSVFYNPGWEKGMKRHELNIKDIPEVEFPVVKYDPPTDLWLGIYCVFHLAIAMVVYTVVSEQRHTLSTTVFVAYVVFLIMTVQGFGWLFDGRKLARMAELLRCLSVLGYLNTLRPNLSGEAFLFGLVFSGSALIWTASLLQSLLNSSTTITIRKKKSD